MCLVTYGRFFSILLSHNQTQQNNSNHNNNSILSVLEVKRVYVNMNVI